MKVCVRIAADAHLLEGRVARVENRPMYKGEDRESLCGLSEKKRHRCVENPAVYREVLPIVHWPVFYGLRVVGGQGTLSLSLGSERSDRAPRERKGKRP